MRLVAPTIVLLLVGLPLGLASAEPPKLRVLGFLSEQGDKRCVTGRTEWVNPHFEVDFTRVVESAVDLAPLADKLVMVTATPVEGYVAPAVEHEADCPMMQMRSDWVEGMKGIRVQRSHAVAPALRVEAAREWPNLSIQVDKGELLVTVKNDLGAPLTVTVNYEGCYGKPGSVVREQVVRPLAKAETLRFPVLADHEVEHDRKGIEAGIARHAAQSISLGARAEGLFVTADAPLRKLGVKVGCPAR